ncbi:AcrR family transcriptional regulator [Actinoplanes tereljensis]|uniref:TetR family transcriptional regulator n=1 Tax=Paractinoplanes tereljensis TaxID=571912 RepID=A0A919NM93_9ACTN|nr:TetR/AcrR family transcriptional regulator [Actinoplanes tereljensis]GIF20773.1 TetR family transcriptional regulator [Actinoplanes tereljensis]
MTTRTRLTAEERHEQLVTAAVTAFSHGGYAGTTTDQVARLAGVSQPYVIRIFRTKQELFIAAVNHAGARIEAKFREAAAAEPTLASLGEAYDELLAERELIVLLLHGFTAAADPAIGDPVRACFGLLYDTVREVTGVSSTEAREFFSIGMLLTCLGAMHVVGPDPVPRQPWMVDLMATWDHKH